MMTRPISTIIVIVSVIAIGAVLVLVLKEMQGPGRKEQQYAVVQARFALKGAFDIVRAELLANSGGVREQVDRKRAEIQAVMKRGGVTVLFINDDRGAFVPMSGGNELVACFTDSPFPNIKDSGAFLVITSRNQLRYDADRPVGSFIEVSNTN